MPYSLSYSSLRDDQDLSSKKHCLIFLISGNPGLIDYYEPFLSTLRCLLDNSEEDSGVLFHIVGKNLPGFDDTDHEPFTTQNPPFTVEKEIEMVFGDLSSMRIESGPRKGSSFDEVILIGHSVGAYIILEIFHRNLENPYLAAHLNLKAGILLFPTIAHLAKSPKGKYMELVRTTSLLNDNLHSLAKAFLYLWPRSVMEWYIRQIMGFPPHAADVTTRFLTSRDGVWQALHLGLDEMRVITEEKWAEEIWEIADEAVARRHEVPKFFFFFGKDDRWVANEYRDRFIKEREEHGGRDGPAHKRGRTRIAIDEGDLPHDFCINHSETVAEKVKLWIDEIAGHIKINASTREACRSEDGTP